MNIITDEEAKKIINKIFDRCQEIEPNEYRMLPDIKILQNYTRQKSDIIKNALEIINYKKSGKEQIDETYLYYFDKCATTERSDK